LTTPLFRLDHFDLMVCQGKDAEAFLQSQLSNDVRDLASANAQWTAFLSAQGRVLSVMLLIRIDAEHYVLAIPHRQGQMLLDLMSKYLLRRKATLTLDQRRALYGATAALTAEGLQPLELSLSQGRRLLLGPHDYPAVSPATGWYLQDLRSGLPWLPPAASGRHLPHALNLDKLPAISLKKGCYPGQEIVARTHYLGRNKRRLCLAHTGSLETSFSAGTALRDAENQLAGELVDAIADSEGTWALAVLSEDRVDSQLHGDSVVGSPYPVTILERF
jgi:tRNA-modifying protein YgfZ